MAHEVLYKGPGSTESDMPAGTEEDDLFDSDGLSKLKPVDPQIVGKGSSHGTFTEHFQAVALANTAPSTSSRLQP